MSRIPRVVVPDVPHHVTQRGNGHQAVFFRPEDQRLYLDLLRRYSQRFELRLWAWCLMPNHVHLVVVPGREDSLARALGRTHADYAHYVNIHRQSCGHLWQARFFSCPLDGAHLWNAIAYVERNPVRAGIADWAGDYRWSSARAHLTGEDPDRLLDLSPWQDAYTASRWHEVLDSSVAEEALGERLREATVRGRPVGSPEFVEELEHRLHRQLLPKKPGRPRMGGESRGTCGEGEQLVLEIGV